jgi:hypothetical protein
MWARIEITSIALERWFKGLGQLNATERRPLLEPSQKRSRIREPFRKYHLRNRSLPSKTGDYNLGQ